MLYMYIYNILYVCMYDIILTNLYCMRMYVNVTNTHTHTHTHTSAAASSSEPRITKKHRDAGKPEQWPQQ